MSDRNAEPPGDHSLSSNQERDIDVRIRDVIALHFDPNDGAPFWIDAARQYEFDPRREIRTIGDLPRLGATEPRDYGSRPVTDYIPRAILNDHRDLIIAQTGGTAGRAVWTAYLPDEYEDAFVRPFVAAADHVGFPHEGVWLYVGPSGPHIIGRAAESLARAMGAMRPFTVDFDPRWAKKLPPGSFAAARYLQHVVDQAMEIVMNQPITLLFSTPPVLAELASRMTVQHRERIIGVHFGGMELDPLLLSKLQGESFGNAIHLSGYGNTLFGCCLELDVSPARQLCYFPYGSRLILGIQQDVENRTIVSYQGDTGTEGRVVFSRLDRSHFIPNCVERDRATSCKPPSVAPRGFHNGIRTPRSVQVASGRSIAGIY